MKSLVQLRMMQHEKVMRQMVAEIHWGKLNIDQAAAKFEITRKTVQHRIDIVEEESEAPRQVDLQAIIRPAARKKRGRSQPMQDDNGQTEALKAQIQTLEKELKEAKFKALYYSTLVQVAGQEMGVDLEKKSVTASADRKPSESC